MDRLRLDPRLGRLALDWVAPAAVMVLGIIDISGDSHSQDYPGPAAPHLLFLGVGVLALGVRRRAPLFAPCVAIATVSWWTSSLWPDNLQGPFEGFVVLVGAAYSLGALNHGRRLVIGGGLLLGWFLGSVVTGLVGHVGVGDVAPIAVWCTVGFAIGYLISRRTEQTRLAWQATRILAAEQERQTAQAIEYERARIARELHDVVAHGLSVIVVQAVAERRSVAAGTVDVQSIDGALGSIEHAGREALVDLRRLLGLLRRTEEPAALTPQPGLAQLEDLITSVRDAGLRVEVATTGEPVNLASGLDLTAYRIVQEALTNVLKHAGAECVRVGVGFGRNQLDLSVRDDGGRSERGSLAGCGTGHGLIGMRERVNVFGGTLTAGPSDDRGWTVHARLPIVVAETV
jgi:signal transduction histidine kinase